MTRGEAHARIRDMPEPRVLIMPDRSTILSNQPIVEAHLALARHASAVRVDEARRTYEDEQERHLLAYGFDYPDWDASVEQRCRDFGYGDDGNRL